MRKPILTSSEHSVLLAFTRLLAEESGATIRRYFRTGYTVDSKSDESPVTVADRQAEERMRALIAEHYPAHGILGEEFGHHQPDAPFQWVLDPIDGTKNFISHSYLFGTLIALTHEGQALLGAINQPILQDLLLGDGETTWLNGAPVRVRNCDRIEDAVFLTTSHYNVANFQNGPAFEAVAQRAGRYHTWGDCPRLLSGGGRGRGCDDRSGNEFVGPRRAGADHRGRRRAHHRLAGRAIHCTAAASLPAAAASTTSFIRLLNPQA